MERRRTATPRRLLPGLLVALSWIIPGSVAAAATPAGTLDPAFGNGGTVTTSFGGESDAGGLAMRSGRIALAGTLNGFSEPDIGLAVFTAAGELDRTFSRDGRAVLGFDRNGNRDDSGFDADVTKAGKVVVVGRSSGDAVVVRWTARGKIDKGFGTNGKVRLDFGGTEELRAVTVRRDGSIVAVGDGGSAGNRPLLVKLLADGTPDPAFGGGDGWVLAGASNAVVIRGLAVRKGIITAVGRIQATVGSDALIIRWTSTGAPDGTFSGDGVLVDDLGADFDELFDVAVDGQGRAIAAGRTGSDLAVVRYLMSGSRDAAFGGGDGLSAITVGTSSARASGIALQADGKIVAAGASLDGFDLQDHLVVRLRAGGAPDPSFSGDGIKRLSFTGSGNDAAVGVEISSKGRIVVGGVAGAGIALTGLRG